MKVIDYENLFIYMSLIFAIGIFVIVLYGCAFSSIKPQIFENFENKDKEDLKKEILPLLKEYKDKGSDADKKLISELIIKIENKTITVANLTSLIDLLKKLSPVKENFKEEVEDDKKDNKKDVKKDIVEDDKKDNKKDVKKDIKKDVKKDVKKDIVEDDKKEVKSDVKEYFTLY